LRLYCGLSMLLLLHNCGRHCDRAAGRWVRRESRAGDRRQVAAAAGGRRQASDAHTQTRE
jgi:hypothetical protein